ncbi:MAG: polysaccharide deacetylase family protein [Candidatus Merdivicinus sp.]
MFIQSFRFKNLLIVSGAILAGLALGLCVLLMAIRSAASPPTEETLKESSTSQKTVWLTFDDGPSAITGEILDVLKEKNVPATFFVIGATTDRGKKLYQRIVDEGHALGIHSYSHRYQQIYASADAYLEDFNRLSDHLEKYAGVRPDIFRFPGGSLNQYADPAVLQQIKERMTKEGKVWFDWNALAKDDKASPTPAEEMFENILQSAGDQEQILILMHDDTLRTTAAECVSMLIDHYQELGYTFEKLSAETDPIQFSEK